MPPVQSRWFWFTLVGWLGINVLQAWLTDLDPDEAYYWVYSRQLAIGYFDHPPIIALLIKAGYLLFQNELGVRLLSILCQLITFLGIWVLAGKPSGKQDFFRLFFLFTAMPLLQVYGFIATPDVPLLVFGVWYLVVFRLFIRRPHWGFSLLLGVLMAALLYSKYHGVIWIGLLGLSHFRTLIRQPRFFVAALIGLVLFFPHLHWQYANNFPSFRYHLAGRDDAYELKYTLTYFLNQAVIFSPLVLPLMVVAARKAHLPHSDRAMYTWLLGGFWIFFFLMSFKGHVEPQWTVLLTIPLVVWAYAYAKQHTRFARWLWRMSLTSTTLLLVGRIFLVVPVEGVLDDFHKKDWVYALQEKANGLPVVFANSYRDPSMYYFYTGERPEQFTDIEYRTNQYDLWTWEAELHGKQVLLAGKKKWTCTDCPVRNLEGKDFRLKRITNLQASQKVDISWAFTENQQIASASLQPITVKLTNPYAFDMKPDSSNMPLQTGMLVLRDGMLQDFIPFSIQPKRWPAQSTLAFEAVLAWPDSLTGTYILVSGIKTGDLPPAINSFQFEKVTF